MKMFFFKKGLIVLAAAAASILSASAMEELEVVVVFPQDYSLNEEHCTLLCGSNGLKVELAEKKLLVSARTTGGKRVRAFDTTRTVIHLPRQKFRLTYFPHDEKSGTVLFRGEGVGHVTIPHIPPLGNIVKGRYVERIVRTVKPFVRARRGKLLRSEEFNVPGAPDPTRWEYERGFRRNRELQFYTDRKENVRVENGSLILEARCEKPLPSPQYRKNSRQWFEQRPVYSITSGMIVSKVPFTFGPGTRIDVRAKIPTGPGLWPAIWGVGVNNLLEAGRKSWPACGEIDILEYFYKIPNSVSMGNLHYSGPAGKLMQYTGMSPLAFDPGKEWHLYSLEWDDKEMRFYFDDFLVMVCAVPEEKANPDRSFGQEFQIRFNLALRDKHDQTGILETEDLPKQFLIDYVRIYRLEQ